MRECRLVGVRVCVRAGGGPGALEGRVRGGFDGAEELGIGTRTGNGVVG